MNHRSLWLLILMVGVAGCSTSQIASRFAVPLVIGQYDSLNEESDPLLAATAIPASLKMLEGMVKSDEDNPVLLHKLAEGFCSYAFSFVEDENPRRASLLYLRGRAYALRILVKAGAAADLPDLPPEQFQKSLERMDAGDLPSLFWFGQCWAGWLLLNLHDMEAFAALPKVESAMRQTLEWDESFHYAGPHMFFGGFYGARSKMLGGDPEKSKHHFERNLELTENKFLMTQMLYAKTYAVQTQNRELFERLLKIVLATPGDVLPEQRLANEVAKLKAQNLLEAADDLF